MLGSSPSRTLCGALLVAAALLGSLPALAIIDGETALQRGDANSDGFVDNSDVVALQDYLFLGTFSPTCLDACDANDDGFVDNSDIVYLLDYLYSGGPQPPSPGPFICGKDPTEDSLGCEDSGCD